MITPTPSPSSSSFDQYRPLHTNTRHAHWNWWQYTDVSETEIRMRLGTGRSNREIKTVVFDAVDLQLVSGHLWTWGVYKGKMRVIVSDKNTPMHCVLLKKTRGRVRFMNGDPFDLRRTNWSENMTTVCTDDQSIPWDSWRANREFNHVALNSWRYTSSDKSFVEMKLGQKDVTTLFDAGDLTTVKEHSWYLGGQGYAVARSKEDKEISLHRFILKTELNGNRQAHVDHKNRHILDNRRCNIRVVTQKINNNNQKKNKNNKTGTTGVYHEKKRKYYIVYWEDSSMTQRRIYISYGPRSKLTQEEALQKAIAKRKEKNLITGTRNGDDVSGVSDMNVSI